MIYGRRADLNRLVVLELPFDFGLRHAEVQYNGLGFSTPTHMKKLLAFCRLGYLAYVSRPAKDRVLYRAIRRAAVSRILELGMECGRRSTRMVELARQVCHQAPHYTGIDTFELSSPSAETLSLKAAHCKLKPTGARIRLVPGDPFTALAGAANHIGPCDLIVIAVSQQGDSLDKAWFYLPRLLHPATLVYMEQSGGDNGPSHFELLPHDEIRRRAQAANRRSAA